METVYQAMNKNITLFENVNCQIKELTYKTPTTYPNGVSDIEFTSELKTKATGVMLMQVFDKALYAPPPGPVYIPWVENNGNIIISTVPGLAADKTYTLRLLVT